MMTSPVLDQTPSKTESALNLATSNRDSHATDSAQAPLAPLLENVVAAICLDARRDSLRYALRSNVGHDGE